MSCAFVCAVDNNSTAVGAADSSSQDVSSTDDSSDDGEGSTGDEEIALDVTYDDADDSGNDTSDESDDDSLSVSLSKHATGIPIAMLFAFCLLPILRRK